MTIGHQDDAGHGAGRGCVDAGDPAVGDRAAPVHNVRQPRQLDVVREAALPLDQPPGTRPLAVRSDVALVLHHVPQPSGLLAGRRRPLLDLHGLQLRSRVGSAARTQDGCGCHVAFLAARRRAASVSHTASTIAW